MKHIDLFLKESLNESLIILKPKNKKQLRSTIEAILKERGKDADLNNIDVSRITDMERLFVDLDPYNIDISEWDVSNVTNMYYMFDGCENFNSNLSNWDVSNVTNMIMMFRDCKKFDSDLSHWDVSQVKRNKLNMFKGCTSLKKIPSWYDENK